MFKFQAKNEALIHTEQSNRVSIQFIQIDGNKNLEIQHNGLSNATACPIRTHTHTSFHYHQIK